MQVKYFSANFPSDVLADYNFWAVGKPLERDVIVHTHIVHDANGNHQTLLILVFFDERKHPDWVESDDSKATN